ncbi:MAG: S-layer homology domain-containing protein [Clostridia bacterium]|nr:S-layer homology domain-containing protein [Clostridia bacterium]
MTQNKKRISLKLSGICLAVIMVVSIASVMMISASAVTGECDHVDTGRTVEYSDDGHWWVCAECNEIAEPSVPHEWAVERAKNDVGCWKVCTDCDATTDYHVHATKPVENCTAADYNSDGAQHWLGCVYGCDYKCELDDCTAAEDWTGTYTDEGTHWHACTVCEKKVTATEAAHSENVGNVTTTTDPESVDYKYHWQNCVCGYKYNYTQHTDLDEDKWCDGCLLDVHGYTWLLIDGHGHTADEEAEWLTTDEEHWQLCTNEPTTNPNNVSIADCVVEVGREPHSVGTTWFKTATLHWQECTDCGKHFNEGEHTDSDKDGFCDCVGCEYEMATEITEPDWTLTADAVVTVTDKASDLTYDEVVAALKASGYDANVFNVSIENFTINKSTVKIGDVTIGLGDVVSLRGVAYLVTYVGGERYVDMVRLIDGSAFRIDFALKQYQTLGIYSYLRAVDYKVNVNGNAYDVKFVTMTNVSNYRALQFIYKNGIAAGVIVNGNIAVFREGYEPTRPSGTRSIEFTLAGKHYAVSQALSKNITSETSPVSKITLTKDTDALAILAFLGKTYNKVTPVDGTATVVLNNVAMPADVALFAVNATTTTAPTVKTITGTYFDYYYNWLQFVQSTGYKLTASAGVGGTITSEGNTLVKYGTSFTYKITAKNGYAISDVIVDGKSVGKVTSYTFYNVKAAHTIVAKFVKTDMPFIDVDKKDDWYYDDVKFVYENGLMEGVSANRFKPNGDITRGMIVTILYRLEGEPTAKGEQLSDVRAGEYYANAVRWANYNGIVEGFPDGTFRPKNSITREQLAAILYRYVEYKGEGFGGKWSYELDYKDAEDVADWAYEAAAWMDKENIILPASNKEYKPQEVALRYEVAVAFSRLCQFFID